MLYLTLRIDLSNCHTKSEVDLIDDELTALI